MKVVALLSWYDETDAMLKQSIRSLAGLADHLVALDGRYAQMHGPDSSPASNYRTISRAAEAAGMTYAVIWSADSEGGWSGPYGGECAKRTALFRHAEHACDPGDWLLSWDTDFVLTPASDPAAARAHLERATEDAGEVTVLQGTECHAGRYPDLILRILFRAQPGIVVGPSHFQYTAPHPNQDGTRIRLWDMANPTIPAANLTPTIVVDHVPDRRPKSRDARRWAYYIVRDSHRIERTERDPQPA